MKAVISEWFMCDLQFTIMIVTLAAGNEMHFVCWMTPLWMTWINLEGHSANVMPVEWCFIVQLRIHVCILCICEFWQLSKAYTGGIFLWRISAHKYHSFSARVPQRRHQPSYPIPPTGWLRLAPPHAAVSIPSGVECHMRRAPWARYFHFSCLWFWMIN